MEQHIVVDRMARISSGVLGLTKAQAACRMQNLKSLGGDRYEIIRAVEFKQGEEFGFDGSLPKSMADSLASNDKKKPKLSLPKKDE